MQVDLIARFSHDGRSYAAIGHWVDHSGPRRCASAPAGHVVLKAVVILGMTLEPIEGGGLWKAAMQALTDEALAPSGGMCKCGHTEKQHEAMGELCMVRGCRCIAFSPAPEGTRR